MSERWEQTIYDLIARTSTDLPADVEDALVRARADEDAESVAAQALDTMLENVRLARESGRPLCQDTGTIQFWVEAPPELSRQIFREKAEKAIVRATEDGILRRNCVDALTGRNTGNNLGAGSPVVHWSETVDSDAKISLVLKGGGCENVGTQYALPDTTLKAGRDLEGVRRCVLHAVHKTQGRGCAPGVLAVVIGGDRSTGYAESKRLLLRRIGDRNAQPDLAELEARLCREANSLGIGPMGFGGRTTVLDVFAEALHRVPASYFVTVSYMCWAYRRRGVLATAEGKLVRWL